MTPPQTNSAHKTDFAPLFETPQQWFNTISYEYQMPGGGQGKIYDLTPTGITFKHTDRSLSYASRRAKSDHHKQTIAETDEIALVQSNPDTNKTDSPVGWVNSRGRMVKIFVHIPFESEITTESELTTKLNNLFENEPDFESVFNRVKRVPDTI